MRRGAAKGSGRKGYYNLRQYPKDPKVHAESARGLKQPQRIRGMTVISHYNRSGKDVQVKEVSELVSGLKKPTPKPQAIVVEKEVPVTEIKEDYLSKVAAKQEKKPSKVVSLLSKAGSRAYAYGTQYLKEKGEVSRAAKRERQEKYIEELRDVEHPLVKKRDKIEDNITKIEERLASGVGDEDTQFDELSELKEELKDIEDKIQNIDLSTFTDGQLKALAVRDTGNDDLFSMDTGNKYERELLRRVEYRKTLDKKVREAEHKKPEKEEGGLFDF